jgi:hypothetical protein
MTTPGQEIDAYLESSGTAEPQRLDVAILFARSMLRELRVSAADWERTADALQELKQQQQTCGEAGHGRRNDGPRDQGSSLPAGGRPYSRGAHP